jgi:hypothetical protein
MLLLLIINSSRAAIVQGTTIGANVVATTVETSTLGKLLLLVEAVGNFNVGLFSRSWTELIPYLTCEVFPHTYLTLRKLAGFI